MVLLVEKYTQKLKDLEANKSDANFKKQKQDLLQKLDNVIEKILNKQETSSEELSDMLESFIDQLTLIYKKIDGVKEPIKKKVEAKAKGESKEDIKNKILKEIITLQEKIPEIDIKLKTLDKYAAMITPPREQAIKIMQLQAEKSKINGMIGDLRGKIFNMYGTYNVS
jgi:chromosome segregation ATPase